MPHKSTNTKRAVCKRAVKTEHKNKPNGQLLGQLKQENQIPAKETGDSHKANLD